MNIITKFGSIESTRPDTTSGVTRSVITSGTPDRAGDRVNVSGVQLDRFLGNPVCLVQHDSGRLPVGSWANIRRIGTGYDGRVEADLVLAPVGVSAAADEVRGLVASNVVR